MKRLIVVCEGETEEAFVANVLYHHLFPFGVVCTSRNMKMGDSYDKFRYIVDGLLRRDNEAVVTSMVDLYGMKRRFPGYAESKEMPPRQKVKFIEDAIHRDIARINPQAMRFIPYIQLHEFEALLFSDPARLEDALRMNYRFPQDAFVVVRNRYADPEHINDSPQTAPSKQIASILNVKKWSKNADGIIIAMDIGIQKIRSECPHFSEWLSQLEALGG